MAASNASGAPSQPPAVQPAVDADADADAASPGRRDDRKVGLMIAAAVGVLLIVALGLSTLTGSGHDAKAAGDRAATAGPPPEQRCIDLWNSEYNGDSRQIVQSFQALGDSYASVGFAADFPDKCLITFAWPSYDQAWQFMEAGPNSPAGLFTANRGTLADLPEGAKEWNAAVGHDGTTISLRR